MDASDRKRWIRAVVLLGVVYFVIAIAFGAFAGRAPSNSMRETWNRLAFLASGIAFAFHIVYEHFRLRNSPRMTASHTAIAVALGAFALALKANLHDLGSASGYRPRMLIALVAWPLLTGLPAFIVALVVAAGLNLRRRTA
jgi:vacuolar-type H+-ATPase subunit I/STV1